MIEKQVSSEKGFYVNCAQIRVVRVLLKFLGMFIKAYLKPYTCLTHVDSITMRAATGKLVDSGFLKGRSWIIRVWKKQKQFFAEYSTLKQMLILCCLNKFLI